MKRCLMIVLFLLILLSGPLYLLITEQVHLSTHWRAARRDSAKMAPSAIKYKPALILAYAAPAYNWRGLFSVHCWIALKPEGALHYVTYQVSLWSLMRSHSTVSVSKTAPDLYWFGNRPRLILKVEGEKAQRLILQVEHAIQTYPFRFRYHAWPGPNSNTFLAYIGRQVPGLHLRMPPNALGKDYLPARKFIAPVPSHSGYLLSLLGIYAVSISKDEGFQLTILGLNFGFGWHPWHLIWPGVGSIA